MLEPLNSDRLRRNDNAIMGRKAAAVVRCIALVGMDYKNLSGNVDRDLVRMVKAQTPGLTTDDPAALALLRDTGLALIASLGSAGSFNAVRDAAVKGELHTSVGVGVSEPVSGRHTQGHSIRLSKAGFTRAELVVQTAGGIVVLSKEWLRYASSETIIELYLRRSLATATDALFEPQRIAGQPTLVASGPEPADVWRDIRHGGALIPSDATSAFRLAGSSPLAKRLSFATNSLGERAFPGMTPNGGTMGTIPFDVTDALSADVVLTDCSALLVADGEVSIDKSDHTSMEMASDPTSAIVDGSPPAPVETTQVGLFQIGATAVRAKHHFAWAPLRPTHSVRIIGAGNTWGFENTSPLS